jgi:hypothetical protein
MQRLVHNHLPKGSDCSYITSNEHNMGDEDPRPAKRGKHFPAPTGNSLLPPDDLHPLLTPTRIPYALL